MIEVFGEPHGCVMFRKVAPWYAKRFGPANVFTKRVVTISSRAEFQDILSQYLLWRAQFLDETASSNPSINPSPATLVMSNDPNSDSVQPAASLSPKALWRPGKGR